LGGAAVLVAVLLAVAVYLGLSGGATDPAGASEAAPAVVEQVEGSDVARLTLTADAIRRLDLRTVPAQKVTVNGRQRTAVPYAAVIYDAEGETWVYTSPKRRTFMRQHITVDRIDGSRVLLASGPALGMQVATAGAQELWGAELGIDGESH
jgi:hypothetical protein